LKGEVIDNLVKHYKFNPMWFFLGQGEPFPGARAKYPDVCGPEVAHLNSTPPNVDAPSSASGISQNQIEFRISDALAMAARVLESRTSYATALYLIIVQFNKAVESEATLSRCKDDLRTQGELISRMQDRLNDLERKNEKLSKEIKKLRDLSGNSPPIALDLRSDAPTGTDDKLT